LRQRDEVGISYLPTCCIFFHPKELVIKYPKPARKTWRWYNALGLLPGWISLIHIQSANCNFSLHPSKILELERMSHLILLEMNKRKIPCRLVFAESLTRGLPCCWPVALRWRTIFSLFMKPPSSMDNQEPSIDWLPMRRQCFGSGSAFNLHPGSRSWSKIFTTINRWGRVSSEIKINLPILYLRNIATRPSLFFLMVKVNANAGRTLSVALRTYWFK
jgi:hypothetical protein